MAGASLAAGTLAERLAFRREEIEAAIVGRVFAVEDPGGTPGPDYAEHLRLAVSTAIDYGRVGLGRGELHPAPIPTALLAQAREATRNGVGIDTVLRRYFAGYALLGDFILQEVSDAAEASHALRELAAIVDRLVAAVADEYRRDALEQVRSSEQRRAQLVRRLLAGELLEADELAYPLQDWHLGVVLSGPVGGEWLKGFALAADFRLLHVRARDETAWAWFGRRTRPNPADFMELIGERLPAGTRIGVGEPGKAVAGWRLSHRQATAAFSVARCDGERLVRYADVALRASALQDDLLVVSLRALYLEPLAAERDGGEILRGTLRAYFAAGRNVTATAARLGVNRNTVASRLRSAEQQLDRPLDANLSALEAALSLASDPGR